MATYRSMMFKQSMKVLLIISGTVCVGLGILGIFLPILPATPFFLLASACYVRGSERLHELLINNRHIGTYISNFQQRKGLPLKAKMYTILLLWVSVLFSLYQFNNKILSFLLILVGSVISYIILSLTTLRDLSND
jgi:uncharacterized protein